MADPFKIPFQQLEAAIKALRPQLIHALGVEALKFIDDNFSKQGFQGVTFVPWPGRKKKEKGPLRKIMVKTGTGRRSFTQLDDVSSTTISSDSPYLKIHNEGGDINIPARNSIMNFKGKPGSLKLAKVQNEGQQRRVKQIRRATIGGYTIHMPQRQMIGPSPVLTKAAQKALIKLLKDHIKTNS